MNEKYIFDKYFHDGLLNEIEKQKIENNLNNALFSLHWELKTFLYLGVLLLTSGLGILIYQNIETIGHLTIVIAITLVSVSSLGYCYINKLEFSKYEIKHDNPFYDYILLLGTLLVGILLAYIQFQYNIFEEQIQIPTLIISLLYFSIAYIFDHRGILSMAITSFAAFIGITIKPLDFVGSNFASEDVVISSLILGCIYSLVSYFSIRLDFKKHFSFTYLNFGAQLVFISLLTGLFTFDIKIILFILLVFASLASYKYAVSQQSNYFLLMSVIYGYVGLTYYLFNIVGKLDNTDIFGIATLYFMVSCGGIIIFFMNFKKILNG